MILVGKNATTDGSVLLAHNNDLSGDVASLIQMVPGKKHPPGELISFKNGLQIPQVPETFRMLIMNCYYGFAEGDAKAINSYQVAIAGGTSLKDDRNNNARERDPLIKKGVSGYIRYIALQRSKTARECIKVMGALYSKYGISYPSGVGVADANEIWYMEAGGGKCWAAQRIPDDSYLVAVNSYRIGLIDFNDKENFITPAYLKSYAIKKGLWNPDNKKDTPFNFEKIFGGKTQRGNHRPFYNSRRIWRSQQLITPSLKQKPNDFRFPFTLKPDQKLTIPHLIAVLRDYYQGTPFETLQPNPSDLISEERVIGTFNTVHTSVIQLRANLPAAIGAILWGGVSTALTTPYVPYYFGMTDIASPFKKASAIRVGVSPHAFWLFRDLSNRLKTHMKLFITKVIPVWQTFEKQLFSFQPSIEKTALNLFKTNKQQAIDFLTLYSNGLALQALEKAKQLTKELDSMLSK
jgi:dipeptidase